MTRSRIFFDRAADSPPYDVGGPLETWLFRGTCPTPIDGELYLGRSFGGLGGYLAVDDDAVYTGYRGVTVRCYATPDLVSGEQVLVARGQEGPAISQQLGWAVGLDVQASTIELLYWASDDSPATTKTVLATIARPAQTRPLWLAFALGPTSVAAYVDGRLRGSAAVNERLLTTDVYMSVGHQWDEPGQASTRVFSGTMEALELVDHEGTEDEEQHAYDAWVGGYDRAFAIVRGLAPLAPNVDTPNYDALTVAPIAKQLARERAEMARLRESMLPPRSYGGALVSWEHALGVLVDPNAAIATRQADAHAALKAPEGMSVTELRAYAAGLFGLDVEDVHVVEQSNDFSPPVTGAGEAPTAYWVTYGDVTLEAGGLVTRAPTGAAYRNLDSRAYVGTSYDATDSESFTGFQVTLASYSNIDALYEAVVWFSGLGDTVNAVPEDHHVAFRFAAGSVRVSASVGQELGELASSSDIVVVARVHDGVIDIDIDGGAITHQFTDVSAVNAVGVGIHGDGSTPGSEVTATWTDARVIDGQARLITFSSDHGAFKVTPARNRPLSDTRLLTGRGRAVAAITATHERYLAVDTKGSLLDITPME